MVGCGKMTSGITVSAMKMEIRSISAGLHDVRNVFGFGSFFRGERTFSDIDLAAVIRDQSNDGLAIYYLMMDHLSALTEQYGVEFDLLVFTDKEFAFGPLRDVSFVPIYCAK